MSGKKLDDLGVSAFCESMAMMVQAGIQTDEAITLLQSDRTHGSGVLEEALGVMKQQVDQGFGQGPFRLPWTAMGIAAGSVFLVVFATMFYATWKIKKDNPIDALKQETL